MIDEYESKCDKIVSFVIIGFILTIAACITGWVVMENIEIERQAKEREARKCFTSKTCDYTPNGAEKPEAERCKEVKTCQK